MAECGQPGKVLHPAGNVIGLRGKVRARKMGNCRKRIGAVGFALDSLQGRGFIRDFLPLAFAQALYGFRKSFFKLFFLLSQIIFLWFQNHQRPVGIIKKVLLYERFKISAVGRKIFLYLRH